MHTRQAKLTSFINQLTDSGKWGMVSFSVGRVFCVCVCLYVSLFRFVLLLQISCEVLKAAKLVLPNN